MPVKVFQKETIVVIPKGNITNPERQTDRQTDRQTQTDTQTQTKTKTNTETVTDRDREGVCLNVV